MIDNLTPRPFQRKRLAKAVIFCSALTTPCLAISQEILEEVLVLGQDYLSLLPEGETSSAFGLNKSLSETPRSVTEVSEDLIEKFALRSVDDLVRLTPGAFTSSFFGIKGAMDIRGEPADNYFRGFRRVANPGAFNTIVRGAEKLEILRGPVSPLYGNGSVGGQLNYIPKTAKSADAKNDGVWSGDIGATFGTYNQRIISGNLSVPLGFDGGMHIFAEVENSESFYDLYEPSSELLQIAFDFDLSEKTKLEFGGQFQTTDSIQVPGWNRVTQDLIDNGTYITGAPIDFNNGIDPIQLQPQESGFITPNAFTGINNSFSNLGRICVPTGGEVDPSTGKPAVGQFNALHQYNGRYIECLGGQVDYPLNNPGTAQLDHETTFIDDIDFADTTAITLYADITHEFDSGSVWKTELFYDYMDHTKFQSWGFTADYPDAAIVEFRTSYNFNISNDSVSANTITGINYRSEDLELKHAFFDETFDFRDLTVGPTPNDRIAPAVDNPLENAVIGIDDQGRNFLESGTVLRNFNLHEISLNDNAGIFAISDIKIDKLNILLGARYDYFDVESEDIARTLLNNRFDSVTDFQGKQTASEDAFSFNTSISYNFDSGLTPYITYAESTSLSTNQLGGLIPSTIPSGAFIQDSTLTELGLKFEGLDGRLYTALTYYDQEKSEQSGQTQALTEVFGDGIELEVRAVVNDAVSIVATATHSDTTEIGDRIFTVINGADFAEQNGLNPEDVYGGRIAGDRATFVGEGAELERGGLPDNILSVYGTYLFPLDGSDLTTSLGVTWVDETAIDVFDSVILPSYMVWTGSVRWEADRFTTLLQINNLTNEEYYTSADLFDSVVVKPSEGRTASLTFTYAFGN